MQHAPTLIHRRARGTTKAMLAAVAFFGLSSVAVASAPMPANIAYLAANCANCHGTNGKAEGPMASLAGYDAKAFVEVMKAFQTGKREATLMHQISKGYTDEQIKAMAEYFAAQKP